MAAELQGNLIRQFRDAVNEKEFVYFSYKDVDGKSHWNAICSCMDWITVAIDSINLMGNLPSDINSKVMHLHTLISNIDIINEAITTLHTVFFNTGKRVSPFKNNQTVYNGEEGKDDNDYFSELRARFGAHPVNLRDKQSKEQHFASWPYDSLDGDCDLEVTLYSNVVSGKDKRIKLNESELLQFVQISYKYLEQLVLEIEKQYGGFVAHCQSNQIERKDDILSQLDILERESEKRLDSEYIEHPIKVIRDLFRVTINDISFHEKEMKFKDDLKGFVEEIYDYLQMGKFDEELKLDRLLSTKQLYKLDNYSTGKLMSCLLSKRSDDSLLNYYFKKLNEFDQWGYKFDIHDGFELTLLKVYLLDRELAEKHNSDSN